VKLGPRLIQCGLGRRLLPYQVTSSPIQPFDHNRHEPKTGGCAPFRGSCDPSNTTSPGPRFKSVVSGISIHPAVWPTIDMSQKLGGRGCAVPFFLWVASWVPIEHKVACAEAYLHTKWHLSPSSRLAKLATTDIGRKLGGCAPLGKGELSPYLTQCRIG